MFKWVLWKEYLLLLLLLRKPLSFFLSLFRRKKIIQRIMPNFSKHKHVPFYSHKNSISYLSETIRRENEGTLTRWDVGLNLEESSKAHVLHSTHKENVVGPPASTDQRHCGEGYLSIMYILRMLGTFSSDALFRRLPVYLSRPVAVLPLPVSKRPSSTHSTMSDSRPIFGHQSYQKF